MLTKANLATLTLFASSSVLLAFDYEGTLAPIVPNPADARMRATTRQLLRRVARIYPTVVISGRAQRDVAKRLGRLPLWEVFGNRGVEPWGESAASAAQVNLWVEHLRARLATHSELVIENKKYSVTIHYRAVRDQAGIRKVVADAVETLPNVRVLAGRQAVNLIPRGGPDKGMALQKARAALACGTAIYIGDDETDEDAFVSAPPDQLLAIRVGRSQKSGAHFRLNTQADIVRALLAVRTVPLAKAISTLHAVKPRAALPRYRP